MNTNLHVFMIKHVQKIWLPVKNKSVRSVNSNIQVYSGGACHQTLPQDCLAMVFSRLQSWFSPPMPKLIETPEYGNIYNSFQCLLIILSKYNTFINFVTK